MVRKVEKPDKHMQILEIQPLTLKIPAYGKRCRECVKMNHASVVCRSTEQAVYELEQEFKDGQSDMWILSPLILIQQDQA